MQGPVACDPPTCINSNDPKKILIFTILSSPLSLLYCLTQHGGSQGGGIGSHKGSILMWGDNWNGMGWCGECIRVEG